MDANEPARIIPEIKPAAISTKETRAKEEDEKFFLSSLTSAHQKEKDKPLNTTEDVDEPAAQSFEETSAPEEPNSQEPQKPLRFLPGVLVGWGGELPPLPDVGVKPSTTAQDSQKIQPTPKTEASVGNSKSPTAAAPRERFIIKKKEAKPAKAEPALSSPSDTSAATNSPGKEAAAGSHGTAVSLKDKPPDVSTEDFLASLSAAPSGTETSSAVSTDKGDAGLLSETEKETPEGNSLSQSKSQAAADHTNGSKLPLSGILKKSSAYSTVNEDKTTVPQKDKASPPDLSSPKPAPVLSNTRNDLIVPFHQGYLQLSQAKHRAEEQSQTSVQSVPCQKSDAGTAQAGAAVAQTVNPPTVPVTEAVCHTGTLQPQYDTAVVPALPVNSTIPSPLQQQQAQGSGSHDSPAAPPPNTLPSPNIQNQNHSMQWAQDSTSQALPGPQSQYPEGCSDASGQPPSLDKDYKRLEERYNDPWERPRNTEDRDHGKHGYHRDSYHSKKSRHYEREKKHDRSHDDKYRERSRHHGHTDDRYGEKRKERHHSDEYSGRHKDKDKDRHRHRRDSDYENGRRSSKDSYS